MNQIKSLQLGHDEVTRICRHISMVKAARTVYRAHAAYLLNCIPLSEPSQYVPHHLLYVKPKTRSKFTMSFDIVFCRKIDMA